MLEGKYFKERILTMEQCRVQEVNKVPEWAHAKHMEMSTPLKEHWQYPDSFVEEHSILKRFIRKMKGLRKMKRERINIIICHSAEEMDRRADALIEQGFQVERQSGVLPVQPFCIAIYRVVFWK